MGNDNQVVVSHELSGFQARVGGRIVVMKEPAVIAPKFRSFSFHIFSQVSQNVTVKVRIDYSVWRNKFMVNNPLHVEKKKKTKQKKNKKTMSMPFVELWTCSTILLLMTVGSSTAKTVTLFLDHNRKSNFHHPL
jgi:hypothetical protein